MSRDELIICDACGCKATSSEVNKYHWEQRPSCFSAHCPTDGINGGFWKMDVCVFCRTVLHDAISQTIEQLRAGTHAAQQLPEDE